MGSGTIALGWRSGAVTIHTTLRETLAVAGNGAICIKPSVLFKILIAYMGNKVQKLVKNKNIATMMPQPT